MSECPWIEKNIVCDVNDLVTFRCADGSDYRFYRHTDPDGRVTQVQFCKRIGRKPDVFECLNEPEWRACYAYRYVTP